MALFDRCHTDKLTWHTYVPTYERLLGERRYDVKRVLELGIFYGESLRGWAEYFINADVVGLDNDLNAIGAVNGLGHDRLFAYHGDVRDPAVLRMIGDTHGPFDVVIDDASHRPIDQYHALKILWDYVVVDGYYFVEDLELDKQPDFIPYVVRQIRDGSADLSLHLACTGVPADDMVILRKKEVT
jgi:cephalosporin hydroxylase